MNNQNKTNNEGMKSRKGLRVSKVVLLSILKVGLPVLFGIFVFIELFSLIEKKNIQAEASSDDIEETEISVEVASYEDNPLLLNEYEEINTFFETYYTALANGDTDTVVSMQDEISDTDKITIEKKADYIEAYENINCYTKTGLEDNSYFAFVVSDVKFYDVEATAPAMTVYYVYTNDEGNLVIDGDMDDTISDALPDVYDDLEVTDLFNKVDAMYAEALAADENLNNFLAQLPSLLKTEVGEALALLEASETTEISDEETATSDMADETQTSETSETTDAVIQVVALDTVNVRSSDSSEADKIGKISEGEVLTCLEQKINGWSKILYNGEEAYVKSSYLEVITSAADGEVIGTVTANSNVNVRSAASQDASKLGVASAGTVYNLLEDLGEWYHIDYEGNNGYVKAEYFTK